MEKRIVAQYTMYVYNTGAVVLVKKEEELSECSSSIRQIAGIINYVVDHPGKHIHYRVTAGVNSVAAQENVRTASVHSKITKKLDLSMQEFKIMLAEYLDGTSDALEEVLRGACVARTKQADEVAVEKLICRMKESRNAPQEEIS